VHEYTDQLLTEDEAAAALKVSPGTLRNRRCAGRGPPFVKIGAPVRYRPADLKDFIESCVRCAASGRAKREVTVLTLSTQPQVSSDDRSSQTEEPPTGGFNSGSQVTTARTHNDHL
jgi:hypothetical protein